MSKTKKNISAFDITIGPNSAFIYSFRIIFRIISVFIFRFNVFK